MTLRVLADVADWGHWWREQTPKGGRFGGRRGSTWAWARPQKEWGVQVPRGAMHRDTWLRAGRGSGSWDHTALKWALGVDGAIRDPIELSQAQIPTDSCLPPCCDTE